VESAIRRSRMGGPKTFAKVLVTAMALVGLPVVLASPASASACRVPPCGQVVNHTDRSIETRWNNGSGWRYGWVNPGGTMGGYFHDRLDIDDLRIPAYTCFDISGWPPGQAGGSSGRWFRIHSHETAVVNRAYGC
jgi:hypothetical protein